MSRPTLAVLAVLLAWAPALRADEGPIVPSAWLVLSPIPGGGRAAFSPSPAWRQYFLPPVCPTPTAGESVEIWPGRRATWSAMTATAGVLEGQALGSAFAYTVIEVARPTVMVLEGTGFSMARLGDQLLAGDFYRSGTLRQCVALDAGKNGLLVAVSRGRLELRLVPARGPAELAPADALVPDLRVGHALDALAAIPVQNATTAPLAGATLEAGDGVVFARTSVAVPTLAPLATLKVGFRVRAAANLAVPPWTKTVTLPVRVVVPGAAPVQVTVAVDVRRRDQAYRETFQSRIDDGVQYYAIRPQLGAASGSRVPSLVLSLHGAAVEAIGQASAYSSQRWAIIACPTNRRPFGFDWEDWGREDALEALGEVQRRYAHDPERVYLTGHSMGGHGAWHLGALHPDRWAAIGPSAGWISFGTYGGGGPGDESPWAGLARRLSGSSDTLSLLSNLEPLAVYVLHGDADDNVPVTQARAMREALAAFHKDVHAHEQPGGGHWWDSKDHPGADCVDWPPMWRLFERRKRDPAPSRIAFVTANPGTSDRCHWVRVMEAREQYAPCRIIAESDPRGRFAFGTTNIARFRFDPTGVVDAPGPLTVAIDGAPVAAGAWADGELEATFDGAAWSIASPAPAGLRKRPERQGPFRQAFGNRFVLVYGTGGDDADRAAALSRARFDAARWWYQGNGRAELVADTALDPAVHGGRNWIFYGNESTHAVWKSLAERWPLRVAAGRIAQGADVAEGPGLACLACLPHPDDPRTLIGLVGGSDATGLRLSACVPYFFSGVALPDIAVWDADVLARGAAAVRWATVLDGEWGLAKAFGVRADARR